MTAPLDRRYPDGDSAMAPMAYALDFTPTDPAVSPYTQAADVAAGTNTLPFPTRAIMVDVAGNVKVILKDMALTDSPVVLALAAKTMYNLSIKAILFNATTATGIHVFQ